VVRKGGERLAETADTQGMEGDEARKTETTMAGLHEERFGNSGRGMVNKSKR